MFDFTLIRRNNNQ